MNSTLLKIIFIHGNGGSTVEGIWFPWLKDELEQRKFTVIARTFPDNVLTRQEHWLPFLQDELHADEQTIIIGHSSGAVAAMRYAQSHKIFGSVLVGPSYTDLGEESERVSGFFDRPWDWESITHNQQWIIQFASTDDPYIPIKEARFIHDKLHSLYFEYADQGHFGEDKKKTEFPELLHALLKQLGQDED